MSTNTNIIHTPLKGIFGLAKPWAALVSGIVMLALLFYGFVDPAAATALAVPVYAVILAYHIAVRDSHYNEVAGLAVAISVVQSGFAYANFGVLGFSGFIAVVVVLLIGALYRKGIDFATVHTPYEKP